MRRNSNIMEVKLTDYGTVIFPSLKEMKINKFFDFFEKGIKEYQITECMYDVENNKLNFLYNGNKYMIEIENTHSGNGIILLNLVRLEENLRRQKEYDDIMKKTREKLLVDARCGNIHSEEARQLYMKELKESISFKKILGKIRDIFKKCSYYAEHFTTFLFILGIILAVFSGTLSFGAFLGGVEYFKAGIYCLVVFLFSIEIIITSQNDYNIFELLAVGTYKSIKQISEEISMVNHKLKYLRKYELPKNEMFSKITVDSFNEDVSLKLYQIYEKLLKLSEKDRNLLRVNLANKINDVRNKIGDNSSSIDDINNEFLCYLEDFEKEIDKLCVDSLESLKKDKTYKFTGTPRKEVVTSKSGGKVRRRI